MTCAGTTQVKPTRYTIACADANTYLQKMHWKTWTATGATGSGTFTENNCTPYCAAGKFISHRATVTLSAPRRVTAGDLFTKLAVAYVSKQTTEHFSTTLPTTPIP